MTAEKKCYRCGNVKPFSEYHKNPAGRYGLHDWCAECKRIQAAEYYQRYKPKIKARIDNWRETNKEKRLAHRIIDGAIAKGSINPPERCTVCNKKRKLDAHHEDYSKPLDVIWLCRKHHIARHKQIDAETAE